MNKRKQLTPSQRLLVYEKTKGKCAYCGIDINYKEMQIDHVTPLHRGGTDTQDNRFPACRSCNHYKSTLTLEEFKEAIERFNGVLLRDSVTYKNAVRFGQIKPTPHEVVFYFERMEDTPYRNCTAQEQRNQNHEIIYKQGL